MITRNAASIDKNFDIPSVINKDGLTFYDACELRVYGVEFTDGKFRRMKEEDAAAIGENILAISSETAGGRVKFATDSKRIAIFAESKIGIHGWPHAWPPSNENNLAPKTN